MSTTIEIEDIKRLRLEPGDHLLVTMPTHTPIDVIEEAHRAFRRAWPNVPVVIAGMPVELRRCPHDPGVADEIAYGAAKAVLDARPEWRCVFNKEAVPFAKSCPHDECGWVALVPITREEGR